MDIDVSTFQVEYANGQFEMALAPRYGIQSADHGFLTRQCLRESTPVHRADWRAVFMTTPFENTASNGQHFSHSLWRNGVDVFYDASESDGSSVAFKHWLTGLMRHAPALMALCCPTVNCYRRVDTPYAPNFCDWGYDNRNRAYRSKGESDRYIENRLPSGAANPYLVMAGTLAAGVAGFKANAEREIPMEIQQVPRSLPEALAALEQDKVMTEILGEEFVRWFVETKRNSDLKSLVPDQQVADFAMIRTQLEMERDYYLLYI